MSKSDSSADHATEQPKAETASTETRIDAAHVLRGRQAAPERVEVRAATPATGAASESGAFGTGTEQLRHQAAQLADYLRSEQREIDRRESQVNAQAAQLDSDVRQGRLWLEEQRAALKKREQENEQRGAGLDRVQSETELLRQRLAAETCQARDELAKQREALERRSEDVDQCRASLEGLRSELIEMHREALESRLVAEELWTELSGSSPAAVLTRMAEQVRAKLTESYRRSRAEPAEQEEALRRIRSELGEQIDDLMRQKAGLKQWAAGQQSEFDRQAARLATEEEELRRRQVEFEELSQPGEPER